MKRNINLMMLTLAMIMALVVSAIGPTVVYADEGTPAEPSTEEAATPTETTNEETNQIEEPPVEETPVSEILEQAPEGTEIVVVNEEGQVEPLATEEAAEIIATSDPMWCPEGATPGDVGCTGSFSDFASLLIELNSGSYTGNGVIWVEDTYNGNDNSQIEFDGNVLTNLANNNLTIQGGWAGGTSTTITGTSLLDVSLVFVNWNGNVTLNDLDIAATDGAGFGLFVSNTGNVALDNVSVNGTTTNSFGFGDGAVIDTTGNVNITDSEFNNNTTNGLQVESGGTVTLDTVSASNNTLTGAFIDTCLYNNASGLCNGNGSVTITSGTTNVFSNNGFTGLFVDSGGGITIDNTQANANGLDGALLTSTDDNGTGNVDISNSDFSDNQNGYGLDVLSDGNIDLDNVTVNNNSTGAVLDSTYGTGYVNVSNSTFGDSNATGNTWTGLHIDSGSTITLNNVIASYNGTNGAYLDAVGDITVTNGTFNNNVQSNYPQDPGIYASSNGGNITLTTVVANNNQFGAGAVLLTNGTGNVSVSGTSQFNGNGTFGIQAKTYDGDITLTDVEASNNASKGAYLKAHGLGNVFVTGGLFVENGHYGIYATSSAGEVNVEGVTVTGNDVTKVGAFLSGQNVFVSDSIFQLNTEAGLVIVAKEQVDLVNVTADQNGVNGVEVYTSQTNGCIYPGDDVVNIAVNVDAGTYTNNGEYGLVVVPGPEGNLVFINPSTFGGNGLGDYLLDLTAPENCPEKEPSEPKPPTKPNNVVQVPFTGGTPVEQDCDLFANTILELPNGTWIKVGCPFEGFSNLEGVLEEDLPGPLGAGVDFVAGISTSLTDGEGNTILNDDGTVTITFQIPEDSRARSYSVLFWDETLNDGAGGWVKLPVYEFGTSFPLHADNPDDGRVIVSGVQQVDNTITLTVNFSGTFILVTP